MASEIDIELVRELQKNIEPVSRPFQAMAERLGLSEAELLDRAQRLQERGIMRRYGAVLRHRRAGFSANAMTCWKVPEERLEEVGQIMAASPDVSHCYQRLTHPDWPYNLFAMVHGRSKAVCASAVQRLALETGLDDYLVLYSTTEYKKERVRYFAENDS